MVQKFVSTLFLLTLHISRESCPAIVRFQFVTIVDRNFLIFFNFGWLVFVVVPNFLVDFFHQFPYNSVTILQKNEFKWWFHWSFIIESNCGNIFQSLCQLPVSSSIKDTYYFEYSFRIDVTLKKSIAAITNYEYIQNGHWTWFWLHVSHLNSVAFLLQFFLSFGGLNTIWILNPK